MTAPARPDLAAFNQGTAQAFAARLRHDIEFGQKAMMAVRFDDEHLVGFVIGESPTNRLAAGFSNQEDSVFFGMAALQLLPMFPRKLGVQAPIGLERRFKILQSVDEGQDRRFVGGQTCLPNANGPAP